MGHQKILLIGQQKIRISGHIKDQTYEAKCCLLVVTTPTTTLHNLTLNTSVGLDTKMTLKPHHPIPHHPTTTQTQHQAVGSPDEHLLTTT